MCSASALNSYFAELKRDFPIFASDPSIVYLDNAATTHKPLKVLDSVLDFYRRFNSNVHRAVYPLAESATELYEASRKKISKFLELGSEELIFTKGSTEGLNILASSLAIDGKYRAFVVPVFEHHSNFVPWQYHARKNNLKFVPLPINGTSLSNDLVLKTLRDLKSPFVFSIAGLVNSTGYRTDFEGLTEIIHSLGGIMVLDGAQLIPHEKFSFKDSNVDFLVFSGHKMLGETGIGCLAGKSTYLNSLSPFVFGGEMIDWVDTESTTYAKGTARFEGGTQNISGAISMKSAIEYIENIGMERIYRHISDLTSLAREKLSSIPGLTIHSPEDNHGIVTFTHEKVHPHDLAEFMGRRLNVSLRSGHHCSQLQMKELGLSSSCRASFYFYNTFEDVEKLSEGIKKALEWFL